MLSTTTLLIDDGVNRDAALNRSRRIRDSRLFQRLLTQACAGSGAGVLDDVSRPRLVRRKRHVGVRFILKRTRLMVRHDLGRPVLDSAGRRCPCGHRLKRCPEALLLSGKNLSRIIEVKHRRHEVLWAGVFIQASNEVAHRGVELVRVHDRGVENQRAHCFSYGIGLVGRHSHQHFKVDCVGYSAALGKKVGKCHIEKVVAGHTNTNCLSPLFRKRPFEYSLVIGVGVLLSGQNRQRPVVEGGVNLLHLKVCALHDANFDWRSSRLDSGGSKSVEPLHRIEGLWQIRLQHDSRVVVLKARGREHPLENIECHLEVAIFLHVQIDERGGISGGRFFVEGNERTHDPFDRVVIAPHLQLSDHRRHLHGHIGDVFPINQRGHAGEALRRLFVSQHGFTKEVDVELVALLRQVLERTTQGLVAGVDNQVADQPLQGHTGDRNDNRGKKRGKHSP